MRFTKTGPNIPDELLQSQKNGKLLFLCGAGVSVPAGLPTFLELTKSVANKLFACDDESNEISLLIKDKQCDRAFSALKRIYGDEIVDQILLEELKVRKNIDLTNHKNLLKLSVNEQKKPFIITTNFDLLFEKADKNITSFIPPYLPDFRSIEPLSGLVYLHGKWVKPVSGESVNLIVSSQDFGKAYLSHGWATKFVSDLVKNRIVVLVGYSGDDTLVRYLLEGLKAENEDTTNRIYALESEKNKGNIESKWSQLGAVGIPYFEHKDLWDTLAEWAKYAGSEDTVWDEYISKLASRSPKDLEAFERGQVTAYISSIEGAMKFQQFDPLPNSEWLYVFDKNIRLGKVEEIKNEDGTKIIIDPIDLYGLDTDLTRDELKEVPEVLLKNIGNDYLSIPFEKSSNVFAERLSNFEYNRLWNIDSRINSLAFWLAKVAWQPAAIWWAQKQKNLHPKLISLIENNLIENVQKFNEEELNFWLGYINYDKSRSDVNLNYKWLDVKKILEKNKTNTTILGVNLLREILKPIIVISSKYNSKKVFFPTDKKEISIFIEFDVGFNEFHFDDINIHSDNLIDVIEVLSDVFIEYTKMVKKVKNGFYEHYFHVFNFPSVDVDYPRRNIGEVYNNIGKLILLMSDIIKKQIKINEVLLNNIVKNWPENDDIIFNRLELLILIWTENPNDWDVDGFIRKISNDFFGNSYLELDFINFIKKQWNIIDIKSRMIIENKIIEYSINNSDENADDYIYTIYRAGRLLNAINETKVGLSDIGSDFFENVKAKPCWKNKFIDNESIVSGVKSGIVVTNKSIDDVDIKENSEVFFEKIIALEKKKKDFLEKKEPFIGIVEQYPEIALTKLLDELRKGNYLTSYWCQLFENISENIESEVIIKIGESIKVLPDETLFECRFSITRWINREFSVACINNQSEFWDVWDSTLEKLNSLAPDVNKSALGETYLAGKPLKRSRKTYEHSLNSPIGNLVDALFNTYKAWDLDPKKVKKTYLIRLEKALLSNGEGSHHALSMIMCRFDFVLYHYAIWAKIILLPLLKNGNENSEAGWDGLFHQRYLPNHNSCFAIKESFIELIDSQFLGKSNKKINKNITNFIMYFAYVSFKTKKLFTDTELREMIRKIDNENVSQGLFFILDLIKKENIWKTFGRYFIQNIWPKEKQYQTSRTSERFFNFLIDMPNDFKDINKYIFPYFQNIESSHLYFYRLRRVEKQHEVIKNHPKDMLLILDKIVGTKIEIYDDTFLEILNDMLVYRPELKSHSSWDRLYKIAKHGL